MNPEIHKLNEELRAAEAYMASPAYVGYLKARETEIADIKAQILNLRPINQDNIAMQLQAFGELDTLTEMTKIFEESRVRLKAKISDLAELENQNAQNTKV